MKRAIFRLVSVTLVHALVFGGVPLTAVARPAARPAAEPVPEVVAPPPAPAPVVNRTIPAAARVAPRPSFSASPADMEITRARLFEEPLVPSHPSSRLENRALARALARYVDAGAGGDTRAPEGFLESHPGSPWRVSLLANLGLVAQREGYFSKALRFHEDAWRQGKDVHEPRVRAVAERAASELAGLLTGLGHDERLAALLQELEGRTFSGSADVRLRMARQGLWLMQNRPEEAFRCGPVALSNVLAALGVANAEEVAHTPATRRGTSLVQMKRLAAASGVALRMARRTSPDSAFPTPAMVHLKTGHFAALLERSGDRYRIADPVFREEHWISAAALEAESTGYVLAAAVPDGYLPVDDAEGGEVWGRSCPNGPDPSQPCPTAGGGGCAQTGSCAMMADYTFLSLHAALRIVDTPLQYRPPKGPHVDFTLTYNQKEIFQPAVFSYVNVGPKWTFDAVSYVLDDPSTTAPHTVKVYLRGGGMETYPSLPVSGPSLPDFRTRATLERIAPGHYLRRLPDGSSERFAQPDGGVSFPRRVFLTEEIDAQGNALSFVYSDSLQLTAIVDALGQVTSFSYADEASRTITRMTDPFGRTAVLAYDGQGRLGSITDSLGLTSSFTYGDGDFITSMTTPYGTTHFTTGNNGVRMWIEAEDPVGGRERVEYVIPHDSSIGPRHLPAVEVPAGFAPFNGNFDAALTLFWTKRAMALAPNDLASAEITHWLEQPGTHLPRGIPRAYKKPLEGRVWYAYEGQFTSHGDDGRLVKTGRILNAGPPQVVQTVQYTRNLAGGVCTMVDPLGRETRFTYGTNNVPDASCPSGSSIDLLRVEQKNGAGYDLVRSFTYNSHHRPLTATDGAGQATTYTYNGAGQVTSVTTPPRAGFPQTEDRTTTFTYDPVTGYLTSVVSPGAVSAGYAYDAYGRLRAATDNDGDTLTYEYDVFDRPTRTIHPDGSYEEIVYDRLDAHRRRDRTGRWLEVFHDPLRRVVSSRDPLGRVVRQDWCDCGSLNRVIDPSGNATAWEYDVQGRMVKETRADGSFATFSYEPATSRLAEKVDAKNQRVRYTYELDDQLASRTYLNAENPTPNVTFSYRHPSTGVPDAHGRLLRMTDGIGVGFTDYTYVPYGQAGAGRVQTEDGPYGGDTLTYGYDELGRRVTRTFEGLTTAWRYDQQGRLEKLTDPIGEFRYAYVGNTGRVAVLTYPNQQSTAFSYHDHHQDRRISQIQHRRPSGDNLNTFGYSYDDMGNVATWRQRRDNGPEDTYSLEYDRADQLVAATLGPSSGGPPAQRYRYAYDPAGNRTGEQVGDAATTASYDNLNRLGSRFAGGALAFRGSVNEASTVTVAGQPATVTAGNEFAGQATVPAGIGTVAVQARDSSNNVRTNTYRVITTGATAAFTHDANGNLASRAEGGVTTTYHWDAENRLVAVRRGTATLAAFAYDGRGRRATKAASPEGVSYVWDGDDVLQERSSLFANRRYVRGVGVDLHLAVVEGSTPTYYLGDHLGTVVRTTNSAGTPVLDRAYDPWGAPSAGSSVNGYAYTGREWDSETGLYHYRARYYDPKIARFLSEDPLGFGAGTNFYAYVGNNPVTMRDPDGLLPTPDPYYLCYRYGICPPPSAPNCKVTPPPISCAECEKFKRVCYLTAIIGGAAATATCWGACVLLIRKPPLCSIICGAVGAATAAELKEVCDKTYALCKQKCK